MYASHKHREKNISRRKRYIVRRKKNTHKDLGNPKIVDAKRYFLYKKILKHNYISCKGNRWTRFHQQNLTFLGIKFQHAQSQRVFIVSWDEKCVLESKCEIVKKLKKFWSWPTSFWNVAILGIWSDIYILHT